MRSLLYICLCLLLLSCATDAERKRMTQVVERADRQNKAYDSITHVDSIAMAVEFFDRHGSTNEQVRAHYLLGCAYRDMGEAPMALQYYQEAADRADTAREDCDFRQLSAIYAQMADLFYEQLLPYDMLEALDNMYMSSIKCNDTLYAIQSEKFRASAFELLGNTDSVLSIRRNGFKNYKKYGYHQVAAQSLGPLIPTLINKGLYKEAQQAIHSYETESGFFENGEVQEGKELYYYEKGLYYLAVNLVDSAEIFFRKAERKAHEPNSLTAAYRGLMLLYEKAGNSDSMGKYARMYAEMNDSNFRVNATQELRHMQSLYNYSRNQKIAMDKTKEAYEHKLRFIVSVFIIILVLCLSALFFVNLKRRQKAAIKRLKKDYQQKQSTLLQLQYDVYRMKESNMTNLIQEKEEQITALEKQLAEDSETLKFEKLGQLDSRLQNSEICRIFRYVAAHPQNKVLTAQWIQLQDLINQEIPSFYGIIHDKNKFMKETDYRICILVRLHFSPKEISNLVGESISYISTKRARLLAKIFGTEGKSEEFDKKICEIC